jgi:hypothetical protein
VFTRIVVHHAVIPARRGVSYRERRATDSDVTNRAGLTTIGNGVLVHSMAAVSAGTWETPSAACAATRPSNDRSAWSATPHRGQHSHVLPVSLALQLPRACPVGLRFEIRSIRLVQLLCRAQGSGQRVLRIRCSDAMERAEPLGIRAASAD